MDKDIHLATLDDIKGKVDKQPFYLLIMVNILILVAFFVIMMFMLYTNMQYTKDAAYGTEYIINILE
jgi:uncharacterized membrane protein YhaH (DUF805 family)